jgi:hypothetical protein
MKLAPTSPPGRSTRKARGYTSEIHRLRRDGYTFEAIREALAAAGVHVSNRTVQREAARCNAHSGTAPIPSNDTPVPAQAPTAGLPALSGEQLSGKDVAEAFRQRHASNPLIRAKDQR